MGKGLWSTNHTELSVLYIEKVSGVRNVLIRVGRTREWFPVHETHLKD